MQINPYESPQVAADTAAKPANWLTTCIRFWLTAVAMSTGIGVATNALHAWYCPEYFELVMGWTGDVWRRSLVQGAIEGLIVGTVLGIVFIMAAGLITRFQISYLTAAQELPWIALGALSMALIGGQVGIIVSDSPLREVIFGHVPLSVLRRFAFVGGGINGLQVGGLFFVAVRLVRIYGGEKKKRQAAAGAKPAAGD